MPTIEFNVSDFRSAYPEFSSETQYPDSVLSGYFDISTCYISDKDSNLLILNGACRARALNMLVAHFAKLNALIADGQNPGNVVNASIDKVSVTLQQPPATNSWQWWLMMTSYGQMLLALLKAKSAGGMYVGGLPERRGFRRIGGGFGG